MHYPDTSFLVGLYLEIDAHFLRATATMMRLKVPLLFTQLHRVELRNTIRLYEHFGDITDEEKRVAFASIDQDLKDEFLRFEHVPFVNTCKAADAISEEIPGCRTLDLLHVATARLLNAENFLSFDKRQREVAMEAGFKLVPKNL